MKIVREEIDYKKQMENNNKNMKKSEETDTVIAVDPTYADAMEADKKAEEKVGEIMKKKHEEQKSIETPDPSTGNPLKKNMYTKQLELDEGLFDGDVINEESTLLPEDVYTMVYDFIFSGLHKSPASIKGLEDIEDISVEAEKYFQDPQRFTDIGVQLKDDEKDIAEYVKKVADALGLSTYEKRYERGVKNGDYVLFVEIPKNVAIMKASKFLKNDESLEESKKLKEGYTVQDPYEFVSGLVDDIADWKVDEPNTDIDEIIEKALEESIVSADDAVLAMRYLGVPDKEVIELFENGYKQKFAERIKSKVEAILKRSESSNESIEEAKETISLEDVMDVELEDDETATGGVSFAGETVKDFIEEVEDDETKITTIDELNKALKQCGIKPVGAVSEGKKCKDGECEEKKLTEDAKIYISLTDYRPWSGAVDTFEKIRKEDKMDELDAFIEEMYPDGLTDTELNDLLWFEPEYVFDNLGIDYDEDEEDEEDDDEDKIELDIEDEEEVEEESIKEDSENPELDKKNNKNIGGIAHL